MFSEATAFDTETSDTDVRHGQVLEFGAVDLDPVTLEERARTRIDVRLLPYVVPSPEALRVCNFEPRELESPDRMIEPEAAEAIHRILRPGSGGAKLSVTFNGLRFDGEMLRFMFWRNLLDPYAAGGPRVRQVDMLPVCQFSAFARPGSIELGSNGGAPSWRLQDLAEANGVMQERSHRAVEDAAGTAGLLRRVKLNADPVFKAAVNCADGRRMADLLHPDRAEVVYHFTHFGEAKFTPVLCLHVDRGQAICAALDEDVSVFLDGDAHSVAAGLFKGGAGRTIKIKHSPIVLTQREAADIGLSAAAHDRYAAIAATLSGSSIARDTAAEAVRGARDGFSEWPSAEGRLYGGGFPSYSDKNAAEVARAASGADRIAAAGRIGDPRLREFAARLAIVFDQADAADFVAVLGAKEGAKLHALGASALNRPFAEPGVPWMTVAAAASLASEDPDFMAWMAGARRAPAPPEPEADKRGQFSFPGI